jgi:hypothetical protein
VTLRICLSVVLIAAAITDLRLTAVQQRPAPWGGRLQIGDRTFIDSAGRPVLPVCAHFGEAFSAWVRRPSDVETQLMIIKDAGYDCVRFWDNLGEYSEAWQGKEISPFTWTNAQGVRVEATVDYYDKLRGFLQLLARVGLAAHHSRGDLGRDKPAVPLERVIEHSKRVAALYDEIGWQVLALYEANNEDFQNGNFGPARLLRIVEPIKARGALVASSCPDQCAETKAEVLAYSRGFSVRYYHAQRDGDAVDRLKRKFLTAYDAPAGAPYLGWDGEPIGPNNEAGKGVTVNHTEDVEEIGLLHAMALVGGRSATTYMSQHGVFWNGPLERQSGFYVTPRMRAAIHEFAPDVMRWTLYHGSRKEAVLRSADGYAGDPGVAHGPVRLDQAVSPDRRRVVALIYGGRAPRRVRNDLGCAAAVTVVHPRDDEQVVKETFKVAQGAVLDVDYRVGRLLFAQCEA